MSAVSRKLTPASSAASITARVPSRRTRRPKLLVPSPTTDTCRSEDPSVRLGITSVAIASPRLAPEPLVYQPPRDRQWRRDVDLPLAGHRGLELLAVEPAHVLELAVGGDRLARAVPRREAEHQ